MKENDWIVATLNNPDFDAGDFQHISGMTLYNTQLLSREQYLNTKYIRENPNFQTDGQFDTNKFNQFYSQQIQKFGEFSSENIIDNYEYSMWDVMRPKNGKIKEETVQFTDIPNPDHIKFGIEDFSTITPSDLSRKELAQQSKIYDSSTGSFLDKSVNDISFTESPIEYFKSLFSDPIVYAVYDSDGTHIDPFTKQEVTHKKGEWKLNNEGEYYTETLNGRSLIGKDVVSAGDYLTSENSALNKYDYFDSDGLDKSIAGTIAKNLTAIAPLVFLGPTGVMLYGGMYVGREMLKTLPMLYGMFQSFTGQKNTDNKLMNTLAAYGDKFTTGTSEYAQQNTFSAENFINLLGEVALQWGQQKAIANAFTKLTTGAETSLKTAYNKAAKEYLERSTDAMLNGFTGKLSGAKLIEQAGGKSLKDFEKLIASGKWVDTPIGKASVNRYVNSARAAMESRMKLGQDLSLVYMSLISNTDVYESVLEKGGTPFEASAIALGSIIGMFAVDKFAGLGEMFFESNVVRNTFRQAWKKEGANIINTIRKADNIITTEPTKKELTNIISKSINKAKEFVTDYHSKIKDHTLGFVGKAVGEGLEEVSEELVADISKSLGELAGKLGYFSQTDYGAFENPFERYMMSFLGGAAGGGLFYGVEAYQKRNNPEIKQGEDELIYLIRNNKKQDLIKELDKLHRQGKLGSTELSYETEKGEDGKNYFITAGEGHLSQNDYVYQKLTEIYNHLDTIINNNQVGLNEDQLFENMILSESRLNAMKDFLQKKSYVTRYQEEFHNLVKQITETDLAIEQLNKTTLDENKRNNDLEYQTKLQQLTSKKKELEKYRDQFLTGELSLRYIKKMLFAIDPKLCGQFMSINIDQFSRESLGKSFEELSQAEKTEINKRYSEYKKKEKTNLDEAFNIYEQLEKELSPIISDMSKFDAAKELDRFQKMMEKHPSTQMVNWDTKLPTESDEDFANRDKQLENEDEQTFNDRQNKRKEDIQKYNNDNIAKFIKDFADMGLDSSNFRIINLEIQKRKKDVLNELIERFKAGTIEEINGEKKLTRIDVERTNIIRKLLALRKPLQETLDKLKIDLLENEEKELNEYYKDELGQDEVWNDLKTSMLEEKNEEGEWIGKYADVEQLNDKQILEILNSVKEFYKLHPEEGTFDEWLSDYGFKEKTLEHIRRMLNFNEQIENTKQIYNQIKNDVISELQSTGQIDPANLTEENLAQIDSEIYSRMQDVNKELTDKLKEMYPELSDKQDDGSKIIDDNVILSFNEILNFNEIQSLKNYEINKNFIKKIAQIRADQYFANLTPIVQQAIQNIENNLDLKAFESLEQNLYKQNPALQFFSKIQAKIGNVNINLEDFLEELYNQYQNIENFQDFQLSKEQINILEKLRTNLQTASAFVYAASKNTNYNSPIGQNKTVNEFINHHKNVFKSSELLPEISEELGQLLLMELTTYEHEINTWLKRANSNRVNKISMFEEAEKKLDKALKLFYDTSKSAFVIKGIDLLEGYTDETTVLDAERMLYENVHKGLADNKFTLDDVFGIIENICDIKNIQNQVPSKLDHKLEYLNNYDKFTYFITTIALSIDEYRKTLKKFITDNKNIVPITLQMYAGRIQQAMQTNPKLVNAALQYIQSKFSISEPVLLNTTICTGVGGAGKTEVLGRIATKDKGVNAWISGPTQDQIIGLQKKLTKAYGVDIWELVGRIIGKNNATSLKQDLASAKENSQFYSTKNSFDNNRTTVLNNSVQIQKVENPPEIIIIDETTHISNVIIQIISKFAEQNNIQLLLLGDNAQSGLNHYHIHNIDKEHVFAWRTPKLYLSLRDTNVQKYYNQKGLLEMFEPLIDSVGQIEQNTAIGQIFLEYLPKFQFRYHIGNEFSGELITKDISPNIINILKNNKDSQGKQLQVAFIGDTNSPIYQQLVNKGVLLTKPMSLSEVQGKEFDYVISDINWESDLKSLEPIRLANYFRNLYTVITRSKKGTIIIDNNLSNNIKCNQDSLTGPALDIRTEIEKFRKSALEKLSDVNISQQNTTTNQSTVTTTPSTTNETNNNKSDIIDKDKISLEDPNLENDEKSKKQEIKVVNTEVNKKVKSISHPIRAYTNIHIRNTGIRIEDDKQIWIGNGSNKDISIFLKSGEEVSSSEDKDTLTRKLLELKCVLIHGTEFYSRLNNDTKNDLFNEESFNNAEFYITSEDGTDENTLIGLTNLHNDKRLINNKLITIIAKLKGKDGNIYTVTLGGVAKPNTWKQYANILLTSENATKEEKKYATKLINEIIPSYENTLDLLIKENKEILIDIKTSQLTDLISKDPDGNLNPELRLLDIDPGSDRTPYDNKTKYSVRSQVYTPVDKDCDWIPKHLIGKPIIFVSNNILLSPNELKQMYEDYKHGSKDYGIRIIPLSRKGVSFKSLYRLKWRGVYHTPNNPNTMPFEILPQGIRMYISMWNFRANLTKFVKVLNEWKQGANSENKILTDDDILELVKLDQIEYNKAKGDQEYIDEQTYRSKVDEETKKKLQILWNFNDSLSESVREFRLGYDDNNGVRIRTLTNIGENNPFYSKIQQKLKNKNILGIYIMPNMAENYLEALNVLFDEVINKIIPTERNPLTWIDKEKSLTDDWFKKKIKDKTSMKINCVDENGKSLSDSIDFQNEKTLKMIPLTMVLVAKYIEARQYNIQDFDDNFYAQLDIDDESPGSKRQHYITITRDGKEIPLNYVKIAKVLNLFETDPEGQYKKGLGLKPYEHGIGTIDRRLDNLFSLMFHGLVETTSENYFDFSSDLRATDADFKFGFFIDPIANKGKENQFAVINTNESLFSTNLLPGFPIITFKIKNNTDKKIDLSSYPFKIGDKIEINDGTNQQIITIKSAFENSDKNIILKCKTKSGDNLDISLDEITNNWNKKYKLYNSKSDNLIDEKLNNLKSQVVTSFSSFGINTSTKILNKINSEQELIDYVNSLLNPIFAKGKNADVIKKRSKMYQYFTQSQPGRIFELIDHAEIINGQIQFILIKLEGLEITDAWTEIWDDSEECCKILTDPNGKIYKIRFDKNTGLISQELISKINMQGTPDPVTEKIEVTLNNIRFTIHSYIDELLNSIDLKYKEQLFNVVEEEFEIIENISPDDLNDPTINEDTIKNILEKIMNKFQDDEEFDDEEIEGWNEARHKLLSIFPKIITEQYLRSGCIN